MNKAGRDPGRETELGDEREREREGEERRDGFSPFNYVARVEKDDSLNVTFCYADDATAEIEFQRCGAFISRHSIN